MNKFVLGAVLVCSPWVFAQQFKGSPAQNLFDQATKVLETEYYGTRDIGWKPLFSKYQTLVDSACAAQKDQCTYEAIEPLLAQLFAELNDGHAFYLSAANVKAISQLNQGNLTSSVKRLGYVAVRFCDTPNGACAANASGQIVDRWLPEQFVQHVIANSPAAKAGLRFGDRILGFNDRMYKDTTSNAELTQLAGEFAKRVQAGEQVKLLVQRGPNREALEITVTGEIIQEAEVPQLEIRSDGVAVLTIKTFYIQGIAQRVHDLLRDAISKNVRGLVINLRGTSGGFGAESLAIIGALIEKPDALRYVPKPSAPQVLYDLTFQDGQASILENGAVVESLKINNPVLFKGPVAVLVDNQCASACEYVPLYVQRNKRGLVYGLPTTGVANTTTDAFPLPNGGVASIPTTQTHWVNGMVRLPERAEPDTLTPNLYFEFFKTGRDLPLEQAIAKFGN